MVGLHEAAIDYLCERTEDGVRYGPKVVCSTATVRRAREQIRALFGREMTISPPRGGQEPSSDIRLTQQVCGDAVDPVKGSSDEAR